MILLSILLLLSTQNGTELPEWEPTKVHNYLELGLPDNIERIDTLGRVIYLAESEYAVITVSVVPEESHPKIGNYHLDGLAELEEYYGGMEQGTLGTVDGKLLSSEQIKLDSLISRNYVLELENGERKRFIGTLVRDHLFMVSIWYHFDFQNEVENETNHLLTSMNFFVSPQNQIIGKTSEDSQAYKIGKLLGKVIGYGLIIGFIVIIIRMVTRKKKSV